MIVERTANALRWVHQLEQIVASRLGALPHAPLQHILATRRDFGQQLTHRVVILSQNIVQLSVLAIGGFSDTLEVQHQLEHLR